jgi:hypothetical protein
MRRSEKIRKFLENHPRATERDLQDKFALSRKEARVLLGKESPAARHISRVAWWPKMRGVLYGLLSSEKKFVFTLIGLAAATRLAYVSFLVRDETLRLPILDAEYYLEWAKEIVNHGWLGSKIFFTEPLYAYLLAIFSKLFGESSLLAVTLISVPAGSAFSRAVVSGRQADADKGIGMVAGLIAAVWSVRVLRRLAPEDESRSL